MKVGFIRPSKKPDTRARCLFALAKLYDIEFFYFTPKDVDIQNKKIMGTFFENKEYIRKETSYPDMVDNSGALKIKHKEIYDHLNKHCILTHVGLGGKNKVYDIFRKNPEHTHFLIETYNYKDINIDELLAKYKTVILKQNLSCQGQSIYRLHKENGLYHLQFKTEIEKLTDAEFNEKYNEQFRNGFIVQRYVCSKTKAGNPFDIRVDVRRGKDGKWKLIKLLPRIGNVEGVVSNISQGGSICDIDDFLKFEFKDDMDDIKNRLIKLSKELPPMIQKNYPRIIDALGFDVGIDRENNNEFKIFEVNTFPWSKSFDFEVAEACIQFYMYLYKENGGK